MKIKSQNFLIKILVIAIIIIYSIIIGLCIYSTYVNKNLLNRNTDYTAIKAEARVTDENNSKYKSDKNEKNINDNKDNKKSDINSSKNDGNTSLQIEDILENTTKSVVGISKLKNPSNSIFSNNKENELGLGSGFIVSDNGYIISNAHVTGKKYSKCYITLENGMNYDGIVEWADNNLDLSIVKINAKELNYITFGDSSKIRIGEQVYAIGNPIGYEFRRTVTSGIISAKNRTIKIEEDNKQSYMTDLIQTDATINPGNSGGPLILANGDVIGINTIKISSADGIGFAIPINIIKTIVENFKTTGIFEEAKIGIYAYDKEVVKYLDKNAYPNFTKGIYVAQINKNGPADNTDLKEKDIINTIDGIELNTMNDLRSYIYTKKPGDEVTLKITRGKITKEIKLKLGK